MQHQRRRLFAFAVGITVASALWIGSAAAAATIADVEGDARVEAPGTGSRGVAPGGQVAPGSVVSTAAGARLVIRFDDGMWAALHERSRVRIEQYQYRPQEPAADRATLVLLQGALRIISGALGHRNPQAFGLRTSKLVIGVRGTDFMVADEGTVYVSVLEGTVVATNAGGSATFGAGTFGAGADPAEPAAAIHAQALPPAVASAFGSLGALHLVPRPASEGAPGQPRAPEGAGRDMGERARELKQDVRTLRGQSAPGREIAPKPRPR